MSSLPRLAVVLALVLVAIGATAAIAAYATNPGTGGGTASSTTGNAVTVTPAGAFTANGTSMLNTDTSSITVICTDVTITGSVEEDGTGTATVTSASCQSTTIFKASCTVASMSLVLTVVANGTFTVDNSATSAISCSGVLSCTVAVTPMTDLIAPTSINTTKPDKGGTPGTYATKADGTITPGDDPALSVTGPVRTDGTAVCTAILTHVATIDAAGTTPKGTGNDLTITA